MKLVGSNTIVDNPKSLQLIPDDPDDLWVIFTVIDHGDLIVCQTSRKVQDGSTTATRVSLFIRLHVTDVEYTPDGSSVHVKGKVLPNDSDVLDHTRLAVGSFHTLDIVPGVQFAIRKKRWDSDKLDVLRECCNRLPGADLAVLILRPSSARLYLVGARVTTACPSVDNNAGQSKYFEGLFRAFVKHVNFREVRCVVIGSAGPLKDEFQAFLLAEAQRKKVKAVTDNKSRIAVASTAAASHREGMKEILNDGAVMNMIKDTKAAKDMRAMRELSELVRLKSERVCYGEKEVAYAEELEAIGTLLITDKLYRSEDEETRTRNMELVESVKSKGGTALVMSTRHVSGEQLDQLSGVAAILRFPLNFDHIGYY